MAISKVGIVGGGLMGHGIAQVCAQAGWDVVLREGDDDHVGKAVGKIDKQLARAGLDYHDLTCVTVHPDWAHCRAVLEGRRMYALSTRGSRRHDRVEYQPGDALVFGPESRGLPAEVLAEFAPDARIRIPMRPTNRSVNLSNAVAVVVYEGWRQHGFAGATDV